MANSSAGRETPLKIVSGGQTGADRAALDWAIERGLEHGGWCPRGRRAEDGAIPLQYRLTETPTERWEQRTEWNVRDSDGTVILTVSETLTGGSLTTAEFARVLERPCLHLSRRVDGDLAASKLRRFVGDHAIRVLNVAGPRASGEPGVGQFVRTTLEAALGTP
jgi:Circularly permutated YpsA SLOG family